MTDVLARIAQATEVFSSLKTIWRDRNISLIKDPSHEFSPNIDPPVWTLIHRRHPMHNIRKDMICYRRLLNISYTEHVTNEEVNNCDYLMNNNAVIEVVI